MREIYQNKEQKHKAWKKIIYGKSILKEQYLLIRGPGRESCGNRWEEIIRGEKMCYGKSKNMLKLKESAKCLGKWNNG